jgi:Xaa-Pro aminopeptidase
MDIKQILENCSQFMEVHALDALYISSFDENISEYVPMSDCHRYYVTGFTGSVAEVLFLKGLKPRLYVDGRYHIQADREVDSDLIDIVKCSFETSLDNALKEDIKNLKIKNLGIEGNRCTKVFESKLESITKVIPFDQNEIKTILGAEGFHSSNAIHSIPIELTGETSLSKLERIVKKEEAVFIQALDSLAWITNLRGYHHPYNSTFIGKAICLHNAIHIFIDNKSIVDKEVNDRKELFFHDMKDLKFVATQLLTEKKLKNISYDGTMISASHLRVLQLIFGIENCINREHGISLFHALKNEVELNQMKMSFDNSSRAIHSTLLTMKEKCLTEAVSEKFFFDLTNDNYDKQNVKSLSFHTIAAFGENSAQVHFGKSSEDNMINESEFALLDSGGFYNAGLATDCTRTFVPKGKPTDKMVKIYTLVLKSLLSAQAAVFKSGTLGSHIDKIARKPLVEAGYDYAHGTGHGVGINVHEGHYSLRPESTTPLIEGLVGSIEPGIYIEGFGGVRLENIVTIVKHPFMPGMLCFEPIVYLGFMPELINLAMLAPEERVWLNQYEEECAKRNLGFR